MKRFRAIVIKEFRHIRRDPLSLGLLILVPALLLVLYGYALSFDVQHVRVAVLDEDNSRESRQLIDSLVQNPYFDLAGRLDRIDEADGLLRRGRVRVVLVIPGDYAARLRRGETARVQALVDAADANTAAAVTGYLETLADRMTRQLRRERLASAPGHAEMPAVTLEPRIWFNPELESARFLVPGLTGMLMMLSAVIATSLSLVRERETCTLEQLMVSPLRPLELIAGKTLPYVLVCLATMAMILVLGYLLFDVAVRGSFILLGITTVLFLFAALGMGVLISSVTRSQQLAFEVAVLSSLLPSVILSGLIFPIANMPLPIQGITHLVAPRYFVAALRAIILKGAPASVLWPQWAGLLALGLLFNLIAARKLAKVLQP